ncbi:MAG: DUF4190 domain-containing protein [Anaerolineales bacterium]|nr:DUF4190 domain-containing protein [Anaerolineales bacterium]
MSDQQYQPGPPVPAATQTSTLAIVSLVTGLLSYVIIPIVGAIAAIITGNMAKKEIRESEGSITGDGLATAGVILGYVNIFFIFIPICIIILLALLGPAIGNVFSNIVTEI